MSEFNGAATGSVADKSDATNSELDCLLAAIGEAAGNYEEKYGLPPNTVRLPKQTSLETVEEVINLGFQVESLDQSPRHVQTLYRWPHSGQWQVVKRKVKSHVRRLMWYANVAYVEFDDGSYYAYQDVDQLTFRKLATAESVGGYLNLNIKEKHQYYRLDEQEISIVKDGLTKDNQPILDAAAKLNKTPDEIESAEPQATAALIKESPGVYITIEATPEDEEYGDAIHLALARGVKKMQKLGHDPNDIALPANAPGDVVKFYIENGVRVASWSPSKPNQVWVGVLK